MTNQKQVGRRIRQSRRICTARLVIRWGLILALSMIAPQAVASDQLVNTFGYFSTHYAGSNSIDLNDQSESFRYFNDSGSAGTLKIYMPYAQSDASVEVMTRSAREIPAHTSGCALTSAEKRQGKCFIVYLAEDAEVDIKVTVPSYTQDEIGIILFDFFADAPISASSLSWIDWGFERIWWSNYSAAIAAVAGSIGQTTTQTAGMVNVVSFIDSMASYAQLDPLSDDPVELLDAANTAQKFAAAGENIEGDLAWQDNISSTVYDSLVAGAQLTTNPGAAYQTIAANFAKSAIYAYGVFDLFKIDQKRTALFLVREIIENSEADWTRLSPSEVRERAAQISARANADCSWLEDWFGACGLDRYEPEMVVAQYELAVQVVAEWAGRKAGTDNPYDDVDSDGIENSEDANPNKYDARANTLSLQLEPENDVVATVAESILFDASQSQSSNEMETLGFAWSLQKPGESEAGLSSESSSVVSLTPDVPGTYSVTVTVTNGSEEDSRTRNIDVRTKETSVTEKCDKNECGIDMKNVDISACDLVQLGHVEAKKDNYITQVDAVAYDVGSQSKPVIFIREGGPPEKRSDFEELCESGYAFWNEARADTYDEVDGWAEWNNEEPRQTTGENGVYVAAAWIEPVTDFSLYIEYEYTNDLDGDGVKDALEDEVCRANPNEQFDSDKDGVCDNADAFPSDPAASVDSDGDGCPDSITGTSVLGLVEDRFPSNSNLCVDQDGDSVDDREDDVFPEDASEWADTDGDGVGDNQDAFEDDPAASVDSDGDGYPDRWNPSYEASDSTTGLTLDRFPNDPDEWADSDSDGVGDNSDWAPMDASEWVDTDGDGVGDNEDSAPEDPARTSNSLPELEAIGDPTVRSGERTTLSLDPTDPDGDPVELRLVGDPEFVTLSDQKISITPKGDDVGRFGIGVFGDDGYEGVLLDSFEVRVEANSTPTVTAPADIEVADSGGTGVPVSEEAIDAFLQEAAGNDEEDGELSVANDAPDVFSLGTTTVTFTVTDTVGNTASDTANVTVVDREAPTVRAPTDIAVAAVSSEGSPASVNAIASFLDEASATDAVDGAIAEIEHDAPEVFPLGTTTVTFTATDAAGNTGSAQASVTVIDEAAPNVEAPADITVTAVDSAGTPVTDRSIASFLDEASATDAVDGAIAEIEHDAPEVFPLGTTTVAFTATDAAGNTGSAQASVTVIDEAAPNVEAPADITVTAVDSAGTPASERSIASFLDEASATDAVDGAIAGIEHDAPEVFPLGTTTVTFTATDGAGNTGSAKASVTVIDESAPNVEAPADITVAAVDSVGTPASNRPIAEFLEGATATDNVDGRIETILNDAPSVFPIGTTTVTFEATDDDGNTGAAEAMVTVEVADRDGDGLPDDFERANGLDPDDPADAAEDRDGDGLTNLEEYKRGTDLSEDSTSPMIDTPRDVEVDATGVRTSIDLGTVMATDRVDGEIPATPSNRGPFRSGRHLVTWTATDAAGNTASVEQTVVIRPLAVFGLPQLVGEGANVGVNVYLSGQAPSYPVEIPYTVSGTAANGSDHNASDGSLVISKGTEGRVEFSTVADALGESPETVEFVMGDPVNAAKGSVDTHTVTITDTNATPTVNLKVDQGGRGGRRVVASGGAVTVTAEVTDPNPGDSHSYDWSGSANSLVPSEGYNAATFTFDPQELTPDVYQIQSKVTDSGSSPESTEVGTFIRVVDSLPELGNDDTDGDGLADDEEGAGDTDGDGVPDYRDPLSDDSSVLPLSAGRTERHLLVADEGVALRLGRTAFASGQILPVVSMEHVAEYGSVRGSAALNAHDVDYDYPLGLWDFELYGVAVGHAARVVGYLENPIPETAIYRKYRADRGWREFARDDSNEISSAEGSGQTCPAPGDEAYESGLTVGHRCVELTIEDGGPNDADGRANGVIRDPGGIAVAKDDDADGEGSDDSGSDGGGSDDSGSDSGGSGDTGSDGGSSGGGGSFGPIALLVGFILLLVGAIQRRMRVLPVA